MKITKATGFYENFERSGKETRDTHYCPGCGHGILHKLICEAIADLGLQDQTIVINPIGCAVFGYYYWDVGNVAAAHGRAQSIASAMTRTLPGKTIVSYQGDGDLGAIGFNATFQAASRGERFVTFFVNNIVYGMTGGQMAPTTLVGQKTSTTPHGRAPEHDGYPLHACETLNQLKAPIFIARGSLADIGRIRKTRQLIRKALKVASEEKGYVFVELLASCPTNFGLDPVKSAQFMIDHMEKEFPLGTFRDETESATPRTPLEAQSTLTDFFKNTIHASAPSEPSPKFVEKRIRMAGHGGQGVLSLGTAIAEAGRMAGQHASWFPIYSPEQRGGFASCTVVVSGEKIGSPDTISPDLLICLNRSAFDKFGATVPAGGMIVCDKSCGVLPGEEPDGVTLINIPAIELAIQFGTAKATNTVVLAALSHLGITGLPRATLLEALDASFAAKTKLIDTNRKIFTNTIEWCEKNLPTQPKNT